MIYLLLFSPPNLQPIILSYRVIAQVNYLLISKLSKKIYQKTIFINTLDGNRLSRHYERE